MKKANPQPQIIPNTPEMDLIKLREMNKYLGKLNIKEVPEIIFFGSDSWSIHVLKALEDNFNVKTVVCTPDSPVANYFKRPILTPNKLDNKFLVSHLSFLTSDLFVVASYGKIIPKEILDITKYGALNIHPSLLPKYRGASPVPSTILNGDTETGVTIIKMDEKMDHGPIVSLRKISLSGQEDFILLINKLFQSGARLLVKIIPGFIEGKVSLQEQNHKNASYTKVLERADGYFDINNPPEPEFLDRMIRAYSPWPGVWCKWKGKIVKFLPGGKLQMEGKKPISLNDFLNGYPDFPLKMI